MLPILIGVARGGEPETDRDPELWPLPADEAIESGWAGRPGHRIHYLDCDRQGSGIPVLVVPGFGEPAEEYAWLLAALAPRRALAVSLRGRGKSDAPATGYRWEDHVDDIEAVVDDAALDRMAIVAISRGASYAIGYILRHPGRVAALLIGDYQARHVALTPEWADHSMTDTIRSVPVVDRMAAHAVRAIQEESVEIPLWDRLSEIQCPIRVVRGLRSSSLVDDAAVDRYRTSRPDVEVVDIASTGHDLWSRDPGRFVGIVTDFLP